LKEVLAMPGSTAPLVYVLPVLMTSIAYSGVGLWWAISMFNREDVLFREAERFDVRLWIRHLLRDKESTPSSVEAVICIVLIMLLQFGVLELRHGTGPLSGIEMLRLLIIQQLVFIGCPALFMGIMLTTSVVRTFRLRLPSWKYLLMACAMPLALHPLSFSLGMWLQKWFFPPLPEQIAQIARVMANPEIPWWLVILAIAVAPAVCEELAFRGFILSGFVRSSRPSVAIVLSSLAFGIVHMVPQQVFNAMLLGVLLALFALRSGSLLPGILFHLTFNSLEIVRERASSLDLKGPVVDWFITTTTSKDNEHLLQYSWPTLAIAFVVAALLIANLIRSAPWSKQPTDDDLPNRARGESTAPPARPPVATR
jgi:sodium transport system permease protein